MKSQTSNDVTGGTQRNAGWRDRPVHVLAVRCGTCGAPIGSPCVSATGATSNHTARRRIALRAEREAT